MKFADLDRAAKLATRRAPSYIRQDAYQSAWLKFLRYGPLTFGGAFMMGKHAMISLMRRERKRIHTELIDVIDEVEPDDTASLIAGLRALCPEETAELLLYYAKDHHTGAERVAAFRARAVIKGKLKGD